MGKRILILGASGFIGNALYKELLSYFDVYGTYFSSNDFYEENNVFYHFDASKDDVDDILNAVHPNVIISCLGGDFKDLYKVHQQLSAYTAVSPDCRLLYISTVSVFDGYDKFPAYEKTKPLALSAEGKYAIAVEKLLKELPSQKYAILRLPLVLGVNAPKIIELKKAIREGIPFEVYADLAINVTTDTKISQQVHYIINQNKYGIFHLGSNDLIHHHDLYEEISEKLGTKKPVFKHIYEVNYDRFLAVLPKSNLLPEELRINVSDVITEITLNESIQTLKTTIS